MYPFNNLQLAEQRRAKFEQEAADYRLARSLRRPRRRHSFRSLARLTRPNVDRAVAPSAYATCCPSCGPA